MKLCAAQARAGSEEEHLLQEALGQLTDKRYGEILPEKPLAKLAVVVSAEQKAVARWQLSDKAELTASP